MRDTEVPSTLGILQTRTYPQGTAKIHLTEAQFMELIYFKSYKSYNSDYVDKEKLLIKLHDYTD